MDIPRYLSLTGKISVDSSLSRAGRCTIYQTPSQGTWFTCTSRDITCFYNGYSYAVGVVDELCDCLYTGDVVCRATDYLNEQGSDSYGQQV